MNDAIKATVEELERLERDVGKTTSHVDACFAQRDWNETALQAVPSLLAELRRLWVKEASQDAIEEAAVRYREASEAYQELKLSADMAAVNYANRRNAVAREDLFAALPPRKEGS